MSGTTSLPSVDVLALPPLPAGVTTGIVPVEVPSTTVGGSPVAYQAPYLGGVGPAGPAGPPGPAGATGGPGPAGTSGSALVPVTAVSSSGASYALAAAASGDRAFDITLTANCALSLAGGVVGQQQTITVYLRQSGAGGFQVALPSNVKWPGGSPPTPNSAVGVIDVFQFTTPDGGVTWFGSY